MIRLEGIAWRAGAFSLTDISFTVPTGAYAVLMGRTGCGKTSLLEILCGLRRPTAGRIFIGERDVTKLPPGERRIGYVPQDGALFPTYRVRDQLAFAPRLRRRPRAEVAATVELLAAQLGLEPLLDRRPADLSGGERQRVALGRALAADPAMLVLDEPLSAVDEELRHELATLLRSLQQARGLTALHVTHSAAEAAQLGDLHLRLEAGRIG